MREWKKASTCPYCGGRLQFKVFTIGSNNYLVRRDGRPSKRGSVTKPAEIGTYGVVCLECRSEWDDSECRLDNGGVLEISVYEED